MTAHPVDASVIIPFLNARPTLPACLQALGAQQGLGSWELILVDNGSTDGSASAVAEFAAAHPSLAVRLLHEDVPGPAATRNCGIRAARGRVILFTDADCIPTPTWARELLEGFTAPTIGAVSGAVFPRAVPTLVGRFTGLYTLPPHPRARIVTAFRLFDGGFPAANLAIRRDVLDRIGLFDPALRTGEDHDLLRRLYAAGLAVQVLVAGRVEHCHRATLAGLLRQAFGYGLAHGCALRRIEPGALVLQLPGLPALARFHPGWRTWIDLNQADKKLLCASLPGLLWPPLFLLPVLFLLWLAVRIRGRGRSLAIPFRWWETPALPFLLVAKAAALTSGRLAGGLRHRVLCV